MGSSPQVRGRQYDDGAGVELWGLIPAGAGQTRCRSPASSLVRAHPRRCGADLLSSGTATADQGSSPQVRGRRGARDGDLSGRGLIPAGAGQTFPDRPGTCSPWAHPRRCGADRCLHVVDSPCRGSSPQVRGRLQSKSNAFQILGLIPAGAGQTLVLGCSGLVQGAHPRRCGADDLVNDGGAKFMGSSPQVRGRLEVKGAYYHRHGLMPAGAGQTAEMFSERALKRAHPRRCGADCCRSLWCSF